MCVLGPNSLVQTYTLLEYKIICYKMSESVFAPDNDTRCIDFTDDVVTIGIASGTVEAMVNDT
mgnify:FL=1